MTDIDEIASAFIDALSRAVWSDTPYAHCIMENVFPGAAVSALQEISFPVGDLGGVSGSREVHNDQRSYFNKTTMTEHPIADATAHALQSPAVIRAVETTFDASIDGTFLRLEYTQDVEGFWLQPHTDLGVKKFTMLIYLSDGENHDTLGTDIYSDRETWAKRTPFAPNVALAFKPGDATWHGFEKRPIDGVRKSLILNYVTTDWRDRSQLAFPDRLVTRA